MRSRGATLLEVLLALAISTLVLGTALWVLDGSLKAGGKIQERELRFRDLELITKRLEWELGCAYPQSRGLKGTAEGMQFVYTTSRGLAEVIWESGEGGIATKTRPVCNRDWHRQQLSTQWQGQFSYLDKEGEWQREWEKVELPVAVQVELTGGKQKQTITIPIEAGRVIPY